MPKPFSTLFNSIAGPPEFVHPGTSALGNCFHPGETGAIGVSKSPFCTKFVDGVTGVAKTYGTPTPSEGRNPLTRISKEIG